MKFTKIQISHNILKLFSLAVLLVLFFYIVLPFLLPILMGAVLALAISPLIQKIEARLQISNTKSMLILMIAMLFAVLGPAITFIIRGSALMIKAFNNPSTMEYLQGLQLKAIQFFTNLAPQFGMTESDVQVFFNSNFQKLTGSVLNVFSRILAQIPVIGLFSLILLLSLYFFLSQEKMFRNWFDRYFYLSNSGAQRFIQVLQTSCREVFFSNVLTGLIQATIVTIGSLIFGITELFLVFFVTFICSFVPFIGAGPVAFLISVFLFSTDQHTGGIGMLVLSIVTGTADNIIRPYLASRGEIKVPGVVNFIAVLGGVVSFGLAGLFLGPLIANLFYGITPILIREIFKHSPINEDDGSQDL